jgi:hypothetical protein
LDWFVKELRNRSKAFSLNGDQSIINAAFDSAEKGIKILASMRGRFSSLNNLDFEASSEAVPTSAHGSWFDLYFLSFGINSNELKKTIVVDFISTNLKKMGLDLPDFDVKLFYMPSVLASSTYVEHNYVTINGFTNINEKRVEINLFPPRDYKAIFRVLVHEIIHVCLLKTLKEEEPSNVEKEVETLTKKFFVIFKKEILKIEKTTIKELESVINNKLLTFSKIESFIQKTLDLSKANAIIQSILLLFEAVILGIVNVKPKA